MKHRILLLGVLLSFSINAWAGTNLIELFNRALTSDPTYQQSIEQTLSIAENVGISRSALLPQINIVSQPQKGRLTVSGSNVGVYPIKMLTRSFDTQINLSQTVFDFSKLIDLVHAKLQVKQAHANMNAALQNLMFRVAQAYLKVLYDEDNVAYYKASQDSFREQLASVNKLYRSGSSTITDVYSAQSAYSTAQARYITAQTLLLTDKDFLSTLAGEDIVAVARFRGDFKMAAPTPANMNAWVNKAKTQNWTIKANVLAMEAARELVKRTSANHLPTVTINGQYETNPTNTSATSLIYTAGSTRYNNNVVGLNLNVPIFSGGLIVSKTAQAQHNYRFAQQQLEASLRNTIYSTRQSYLNLMADTQKIHADKLAIQSAQSAVLGMQKRYQSGSSTIMDVISEQEKLVQAKSQYSADRYSYLINLLTLKNAAGTLCIHDLEIINSWLAD